jgi:aminoglycoside phosphotransferase family enzyme/predicted kinase
MSADFERILADLSRPEAYPHPAGELRIAQTHISAVFLAGEFAYKVKKPVDFGFLDYSTFELRERFCREELRLNRRLSPAVYLGLAGVVEGADGRLGIDPAPGETAPLEWVVKMRRLPEARMLPALLTNRQTDEGPIRCVADRIAAFHARTEVDDESRSFGAPAEVEKTVAGNLRHAEEAAGPLLAPEVYERLRGYIADFVHENRSLLGKRAAEGKVRRCHGDLRLQNICLDPNLGDGIQIFDCIEFNARYQCVDVIADLAYLAMDLDLAGRADLRWALVDEYRSLTSDAKMEVLLPFYQCYRACVRGKIGMLAASDNEIPETKRREEAEMAQAAFELALSYASRERRPTLFAMHGFSGSGKSTVATRIARTHPAVLLSTDAIRKEETIPSRPLDPHDYKEEKRDDVYRSMFARARHWLSLGESVVLDGTFLARKHRNRARRHAESAGALFRIIDCSCPDDEIRLRLKARAEAGESPSDATEAVYELQLREADPLGHDEQVETGYTISAQALQ